MINKITFILVICVKLVCGHLNLQWDPSNPAFDPSIYEDALDSELCERQLSYITTNNTMLRLQFLDAGVRLPRGFLIGNTLDMGNYHQCLGINHRTDDMVIQGKYCMIRGPLDQNFGSLLNEEVFLSEETLANFKEIDEMTESLDIVTGNIKPRLPGTPLAGSVFRVAVCVPKACTTGEGMSGLLFNVSNFGLRFEDNFCRLPDDKPWVPVDYVAISVLSLIGLITLVSTCYDLCHVFYLKKDSKTANTIYRSFSLYTNARRLTTYTSSPGSLESVDGVRALAMAWVIVGHTFTSQSSWSNPLDTFQFTTAFSSLWITSAHITVDTFFFLSGLLVVYTTSGKLTGIKLLKNIHLFYLNRLLRMFPVLAVGVLLEASIAHRVSDGPNWQSVATQANRCRSMWWTTLLHVQNYVSPRNVCIGQTWYLAIDVQLHIISPLVLVWVVGSRRKIAWIALIAGLLTSLTAATIYNFIKEFPSGMMTPGRGHEMMYYMVYYYMNTLTRASPFFVGMVFGYLLYMWRAKDIKIPKIVVAQLWFFALVMSATVLYATYPALQVGWDNQLADTLINSFQRPVWAMTLGWMVLACEQGYGGPINWFLSLRVWKLPARISYAMYILHWSLMTIVAGSRIAPAYFTVGNVLFDFMAFYALTFVVSFIVTVIVDSPCSTLFKLILGGGDKKKTVPKKPLQRLHTYDSTKSQQPTTSNGITNSIEIDGDEAKSKF